MTTRDRILSFIETTDHSPTIREIAQAVGLKSTATVHTHLEKLEAEGRIRRLGEQRRIYPMKVSGEELLAEMEASLDPAEAALIRHAQDAA